MSLESATSTVVTTTNPLIDGYVKIFDDLYRYSGSSGVSFPIVGDIYRRNDVDTFFSLFKLLYEQNPAPIREAILHLFNKKIEHEISPYTKKIFDNEPSSNSNGMSRFEEKHSNVLFFTIQFANALNDKSLMDKVYSAVLSNKRYKRFFIIKDQFYSSANMLFAYAPEDIKKKMLDRILADTKKHFPKTHTEYSGSFIQQLLRVKSSSDRSLHYVDWFVKNYSVEEREMFLSWVVGSWRNSRTEDYMNSYDDIAESVKYLTVFHPSIKKYFEEITFKVLAKHGLDELAKSRFFYGLKHYNVAFKQSVIHKVYVKCKKDEIDFFEYIKKHEQDLGRKFIERLANLT